MLGTTRIESSANIVNTTNNLPTNTNNQSKDNSFLRWINPFNNNNNNSSNTTNSINDSNINCRGSTPNLDNKNILNDNNTNTEYRGVDSLKQFWNNRISLTKLEKKDKNKLLSNKTAEESNNCNKNILINSTLTSSKSYGCLISSHCSFDSSNKTSCDNSIIVENLLRHPSSSSSYCSSIEQEGYHRKSDNFYKYKTAATTKPLSLDLTKNIVIPTTTSTNQINSNNEIDIKRNSNETNRKLNNLNGINFPLIASTSKGEKIHWARREDIFVNRKQKPQLENTFYDIVKKKLNSVQINNNNKININNVQNKILDENKLNIKLPKTIRKDNINNKNIVDNKTSTYEKVEKSDNNNTITTTITTTVMAIKSTDNKIQNHQQTINTTSTNMAIPMLKKDNILDKTDKYNSQNTLSILSDDLSSINSSTNSLLTPTSTDSSIIRKKNNSPAVRKYSFKTHATKNLYTPRKMTNHHHQIVGSKVAALTMQFNQMVEKDSAILDEVKRKNGIIMARSGHVYKIKEETDSNSKRKTLLISSLGKPSSESEEGSIKSMKINKKKNISRKLKSSDGTVRATIRKFEGSPINQNTNHIINELDTKEIKAKEKPQVPQKSEHVLKRTKDLQLRNLQKKPKPTTIEIHMEEIKEEIKTPITETKEIVIESEVIPSTTLTYADIIQQSIPEQTIKILPNDKANKDSEEDATSEHDSEESPSKKSRYARIYEKFRFRSTFFTNKKLQENRDSNLEKSPPSPDKKIKDAIENVNVKLEHLSKSENDVSLDKKDNENFVHDTKMQANESFLFRTYSKKMTTPYVQIQVPAAQNQENQQSLVEAINTRIINKTQSMDEIRFPSLQIRNLSLDESMNYSKTNNKYNDEDDELYEPIDVHKTENIAPQKSFLFQRIVSKSQINDTVSTTDDDSNNIYQTITDAKLEQELLENKLRIIENQEDYDADCYENYESVPEDHLQHQTEDGYEICDPQSLNQKLHPRVSDIQRNTTDELPALPEPKRIIQHNKNFIIGNTQPPPPRPKKLTENRTKKLPDIPIIDNNKSPDVGNVDDDEEENIYDTIKGSELTSNCYEYLNNSKNSPKSLDTVSLISNCYETISSVRRGLTNIRNSDSISTTSSDHKTNSLYGMQMNGGNNSIHNTDGSSDNNSDDWIDISDGDDEGIKYTKQQFVVVRERTKCHRSPDWSKRVRDQRIHQQSQNYFDDDSDHYYEPLFPSSVDKTSQIPTVEALNGELVNKLIITSDNNGKTYQKTVNKTATQGNHHHHHHHHHSSAYSDDYDSFDTDDETDEEVKKNDSGVDISNAKLPDPPQTSNQVYALVKKFKNFISNKKLSTSPKSDNNSGKQYENTQFYVSPNEYQNTKYLDKKLTKKKTPKLSKKLISRDSDDPYENTEFHAPIIPKPQPIEPINNNSSPTQSSTNTTILSQPLDETSINKPDLINRRKSKSEKSFKSKLRKSLTGNSHQNSTDIANTLNSTRSTFYISDSVDLDSGIFEKTNNITQPLVGQTILPEEINIKQTETEPENPTDRPIPVTRKSKRNLRSPDLNRRRTTIGIRPNNPPPPPPTDKKPSTLQKQRSTTSWYAECGVFKGNGIGGSGGGVGCGVVGDELKESRRERNSNSSWYAEAGLYQTSGASVASSSGSSGVSTGGEGCPGDDNNSHSMFLNEPLYQIYSAAKLESISRDMEDQDSTDGYEEIGGGHIKRAPRPSALQLVGPKQGPSRTLWSEIPEVINSEILSTLTPTEKRLQEAKFEVLTSEASYLKSLNLLRSHFMNNADFRDPSILKPADRKTLFAHIIPVYECSDRLLSDLERCWQDNIMLLGLSKSIYKNAEKYFNVYISFCEHQGKMDRTLRRLKEQKGDFSQKLDILEHDAACCGLNLHSFLMLPMQRITRLPLLIDAVFSKVKGDDDEYENWKMTLSILNKIVLQCNEAANRCEQSYEIEKISRQIEFPSNIRSIAIAPVGVPVSGAKPRALVKKGELVHFIWRGDDAKLTFGKKFSKSNIYAFLFTDLLILSKKKSDEQFIVFDYCQRSMLTISSGDVIPQLPTKDIHQAGKNLILMTLLENHEGKTIEMILSCPSVSDQQRWLEATAPREPEQPGEKLYEQWDCPQVIAKHEYLATEPDLLSLEPGDVVNVTRKLPDGWYQGERIRDGVCGWFPGSFTEEVNSAHVRARNLKQRYRLLTFTASYLEMQKRK